MKFVFKPFVLLIFICLFNKAYAHQPKNDFLGLWAACTDSTCSDFDIQNAALLITLDDKSQLSMSAYMNKVQDLSTSSLIVSERSIDFINSVDQECVITFLNDSKQTMQLTRCLKPKLFVKVTKNPFVGSYKNIDRDNNHPNSIELIPVNPTDDTLWNENFNFYLNSKYFTGSTQNLSLALSWGALLLNSSVDDSVNGKMKITSYTAKPLKVCKEDVRHISNCESLTLDFFTNGNGYLGPMYSFDN